MLDASGCGYNAEARPTQSSLLLQRSAFVDVGFRRRMPIVTFGMTPKYDDELPRSG